MVWVAVAVAAFQMGRLGNHKSSLGEGRREKGGRNRQEFTDSRADLNIEIFVEIFADLYQKRLSNCSL